MMQCLPYLLVRVKPQVEIVIGIDESLERRFTATIPPLLRSSKSARQRWH